jgi:hypothetical protein
MSDRQKIAAWIAFGTIGGGALSILFLWLFDLMVGPIAGTDLNLNLPRQFVLGATTGGCVYSCSLLWRKYNLPDWAALIGVLVVGLVAFGSLGFWPAIDFLIHRL